MLFTILFINEKACRVRQGNMSYLCYFVLLCFVPQNEVLATGPVNWTTSSSHCQSKYDSRLIPRTYIEDRNLSGDIIQELGVGVSAWIDGQTQHIGCFQENCLTVKMLHQKENRKLPYVCARPMGISIHMAEVLYQDSRSLCNDTSFKLDKYAYTLRSSFADRTLYSSPTTFWLPHAELSPDSRCSYITTGQKFLETLTGNCSIQQLGICINNTYVSDFHPTVMLEVARPTEPTVSASSLRDTSKEVSTLDGGLTISGHWEELQQSAGNDTDYLPTDRSNERNLLEIQEYISFGVAGFSLILVLVTMCVSILLWKRMSSKLKTLAEYVYEEKKPKKKTRGIRNGAYERLPQFNPERSTRVKVLRVPDENPYSRINNNNAV